jgi:mannose/fructose-specific phosphotransferase system component IIA
MDKQYLTEAAKALHAKLPDNHGFILLTFPFGESPKNRVAFVSNAKREDAIATLKEFLFRNGAEEDWMKHIQ